MRTFFCRAFILISRPHVPDPAEQLATYCETRRADPGVAMQLAAIIASGITGAVIGDQLHGSVSDAAVVRIILVLLSMGSISMITDLKGGSSAAHVLVGCMGCITIGGLALLISLHLRIRCKRCDVGNAPGDLRTSTGDTSSASSIPVGAYLCDKLLFGDVGTHARKLQDLSVL